jgi:hypothetical protein
MWSFVFSKFNKFYIWLADETQPDKPDNEPAVTDKLKWFR